MCAIRRDSIYLSYFQFHHISSFTYYKPNPLPVPLFHDYLHS